MDKLLSLHGFRVVLNHIFFPLLLSDFSFTSDRFIITAVGNNLIADGGHSLF